MDDVTIDEDTLTDILCAMLTLNRAFGYVFSWTGGSHKSVMGHYSFFEMSQMHAGAVATHYIQTGANPTIYAVMCGRMTPTQKQIVRERSVINVEVYLALLTWFITQSGHPGFKNMPLPTACPQPILIQDPSNKHNTAEEGDPEKEKQFEGATYHFSSAHEPTTDSGCFDSSSDFAMAMLKNTTPTLLVHGSNYANSKDIQLENVFPVCFPFGQGGPQMMRRVNVSADACLKHYLRLSLCQFMRPDFCMVANHMNNRSLSYTSGMIRCRSQEHGKDLADKVSTLTAVDIQIAASL